MSSFLEIFACPVCRLSLSEVPPECDRCHNSFRNAFREEVNHYRQENYPIIHLTQARLQPEKVEVKPLRTEIFRSPIIPFLYERILPPIWAMGLRNFGGINLEVEAVKEFFGCSLKRVADVSCGSGLMARRLAQTGWYEQIVAVDYSESMLKTLQVYLKAEQISAPIAIVQADVEALPFKPNSLDAIYSGAAIHCWPDPVKGLTNIYQVLRSGGKLFATTFLKPLPSIVFRFFTPQELKEIFTKSGFDENAIEIECQGVYATIKSVK